MMRGASAKPLASIAVIMPVQPYANSSPMITPAWVNNDHYSPTHKREDGRDTLKTAETQASEFLWNMRIDQAKLPRLVEYRTREFHGTVVLCCHGSHLGAYESVRRIIAQDGAERHAAQEKRVWRDTAGRGGRRGWREERREDRSRRGGRRKW